MYNNFRKSINDILKFIGFGVTLDVVDGENDDVVVLIGFDVVGVELVVTLGCPPSHAQHASFAVMSLYSFLVFLNALQYEKPV